MSNTNSSYKLKKIHPIILKNDNQLYQKYIKDRIMTTRNKKLSFPQESDSKINNNIKALISPNFEKLNKFRKSYNSNINKIKVKNKNYNLNAFNNVNIDLNINNNFFKEKDDLKKSNINRVKTPSNKKLIRYKKYKINKATDISNDSNKIKINSNFEANNEKLISTEKSEKINANLSKQKKILLANNNFPFKKYYSYNNKILNKKLINRMNFITNASVKTPNLKLSNNNTDNVENIYSRTLNNDIIKKFYIKRNKKMESLNENSIWNEYTKLEKYKKFQQLKSKRKMKEDILNMIKLFRNSYSFKKYNNKILNNKEKYLNFLDDHSLGLRENIIKNNIQDDRGGKQNLRKIYDPKDV